MGWSTWMDSEQERDEYLWTVHTLVPASGGLWGQPMFSMKYTSCEDPTRESCSCVMYDEKHKDDLEYEGIKFSKGVVWSAIMAQPEESLMSNQVVDDNM